MNGVRLTGVSQTASSWVVGSSAYGGTWGASPQFTVSVCGSGDGSASGDGSVAASATVAASASAAAASSASGTGAASGIVVERSSYHPSENRTLPKLQL